VPPPLSQPPSRCQWRLARPHQHFAKLVVIRLLGGADLPRAAAREWPEAPSGGTHRLQRLLHDLATQVPEVVLKAGRRQRVSRAEGAGVGTATHHR